MRFGVCILALHLCVLLEMKYLRFIAQGELGWWWRGRAAVGGGASISGSARLAAHKLRGMQEAL